MHDKLSQAVKLYDQLLTEQVSHPTWMRSPPPAAATPYQPIQSGYNPAYQTVNGAHAQWAPSQTQAPPTSPVYQPYDPSTHTPQQAHSPQVSYFNPSLAQEYHRQYASPVGGETSYVTQTPPTAVTEAQQQWHHQPQYHGPPQSAQYPESSQQPQQHPDSASTPMAPPPAPEDNALQQSQALQSPVSHQTPTIPTSLPQPSQVQPQAHLQQSAFTPSKSTSSALSSLSRHNTTSYTSHRSQQSPNSHLSRHNTISTAHQPHVQPQPSLPQFPVAPTSAPQTFPMYGPSIPSSVPQPERKEALLIDL